MLVNVPVMLTAGITKFDAPPVNPMPDGAAQVYLVLKGTTPFVPFTGVAVNGAPLHTVNAIGVIAGTGFTFTVTVKVFPTQLPNKVDEVGVTVYMACPAVFEGLMRVPKMFVCGPTLAAPPVNPPVTVGAPHV